jgi:hypothetical protein
MSGGISAIRGFDYQSTVILDLLFDHFDHHGPSASVRPEGEDDLDLRWTDAGVDRRLFVQIKKPTEDAQACLNPSPWSLTDIVRELLLDAVARLTGNDHEQVWVLGDAVAAPVRELFDAGANALHETTNSYWTVIHSHARAEAQKLLPARSSAANAASRWRMPKSLPSDPQQAQSALTAAAHALGQLHGLEGAAFAQRYIQEATWLNALLPSVLGRIKILDANGAEIEVAQRVMQRLEQRYGLKRSVIEFTLFRNLRGFINDIAKQPGRCFNHEELETELRSVWPHMVPIKAPPPLADDHIMRPGVVDGLIDPWTGVGAEIVGISGSGKTRLAAEILQRSRLIHPNRIVLYAEVRIGVSLRDCLVGAAFHLRRLGISKPFGVAIQPDQTDEGVLAALAKVFSNIPNECLLLLDLVGGDAPPGFARDLATFLRGLPDKTLRLIVFGQESSLRELTTLEQSRLGVRRFDTPGLSFEEFVTLVGLRHSQPDRAQLSSLYRQITAGRAAGLNVSLAQALARAQTTDEMVAIAARPAEERLAFAERNRFARMSTAALGAAEKLTCFALPFRRTEAERVFPSDNVGLAIRELLDLGLLRRHDGESFEMHETVRAGLEGLIAPQTRQDVHGALADWYRDSAQIEAAILHMELAGRSQEARTQAREAFLAGEIWTALWPYVVSHRLVSATEVITVIAGPRRIADAYLLPDILRELKVPPHTEALMRLIREQSERALADPLWVRPILEAILESEPSRLDDLIELLIQAGSSPEARANALRWLSIATHRWSGAIGPSTLALFDRQPETIQRAFLGLLLRGGCAALRHAFQHLYKHPELVESRGGSELVFGLNVRSSEDVVDILQALPTAIPVEIVRSRSPRLGPVGKLIWGARKALRTPCIAALQAQTLDSGALVNAIRILLFLGEPTVLDLCEGLRRRTDTAGMLANLAPAIFPAIVDWNPYKSRVLDQTAEFSDRGQALITLACAGRGLNNLLDHLRAADPANWPRWAPILQIIATVTSFAAATGVLGEALASGEGGAAWLPSIIARQGETPGYEVTAVLLQALSHRDLWVRRSATEALAHRRDRAALPQLIERYAEEEVPMVQESLATAILASGATSAAELAARSGTFATDLWWCVLVHRTRDLSAAGRLVSIALAPTQPWQLRRAAIAAAGRLPYETALSRIELSVMAERLLFAPSASDQMLNNPAGLLLHAAVLRALRLCDRPDRIEAHLTIADNEWLATKALLELSKLPGRGPALGQRLQDLIAGATWADDRAVNELVSQLSTSPSVNTSSQPDAARVVAATQVATQTLTYEAATRLLSGASDPPPGGPLVLEPLTSEECKRLIVLADPAKDPERGETIFISAVSFAKDGHQVSRRQTTHRGGPFLPDRLRPAIAAANRFGLPIPWHTARLDGPLSEEYAFEFLACLAAQGDDARFYAALAEAEDPLMPVLCQKAQELSTQLKIDSRLIPAFTRFLSVGGDDLFKGLCILAKCIDAPEIVPVLEGLLHRWVQRFDVRAVEFHNSDEAFDLWSGFARLCEHSRFESISDWPQQLEAVLMTPMAWYHAQSIVRVLEKNPGSYTLIEARLIKEVDWEHYHEDEIDRLDRAAEARFGQTQDSRVAASHL